MHRYRFNFKKKSLFIKRNFHLYLDRRIVTELFDSFYEKKVNMKLLNDFIHFPRISNEIECWNECLKKIECTAITFFRKDSNDCYLFKDGYRVVQNSTGWISYLKGEKKFNLKAGNFYKDVEVYNEKGCWEACVKDLACHSITFHQGSLSTCFLNNNIQQLVFTIGWVSIFKAKKVWLSFIPN